MTAAWRQSNFMSVTAKESPCCCGRESTLVSSLHVLLASVRRRAKELGVRLVRQAVKNKLQTYNEIKRARRFEDAQIAYMGDDLVDLPVLRQAGLSICVADSWPELISRIDMVTAALGGRGAVREVADFLLKAQGKWSSVTKLFT